MAHIFISYSKQDIDFTRYLKRSLEVAGFVVWMDETAVRPSARWWPTIERNIETSAAFIVVMSPNSRESDWVERELLYAERLNKPIFPVLFQGEDWPRLANIQYSDMTAGLRAALPVELEDGLNGLISTGKMGLVEPPIDLPGERIPERSPAASRSRFRLGRVIVLVVAIAAALVGGIWLGSLQNDVDETPMPEIVGDATFMPTEAVLSSTLTPTIELATTHVSAPAFTVELTNTPAPTIELTHTPSETPTPTEIALSPVPTLAVGSSNADWQPVVNEYNGIEMVYVPAGCFEMGDVGGEYDQFPHDVCLSAFWISQMEITNRQYRYCVNEGGCEPPTDVSYYDSSRYLDDPVVYVNWSLASDFAMWFGGSLPTEAQWEYAARGPEAWEYPWGYAAADCERANIESCDGAIAAVGPDQRATGASWVGALDMAGNAWEWVQDWYSADYYRNLPRFILDPPGPSEGTSRGMRGGSWNNPYYYAFSAYRNYLKDPNDQSDYIGFRVVLPADVMPPGN